jgi:hypothetical protein
MEPTAVRLGGPPPASSRARRLALATLAVVVAERARPAQLDLGDVRRALVFVVRPEGPQVISLHRVWLE